MPANRASPPGASTDVYEVAERPTTLKLTSCGEAKIGDSVRYEGRVYVIRGFTHASSATQYVILADEATGESETVPLTEVERA